jgi:eukaryotic-like serine/threonine-protein kinase
MESLEGETLEQRLRRGPVPTAELFSIAIAIAEALEAAHREGIIHRDLKPSNVMLTRSGLKLLDFGIAKQREIRGQNSTASLDATSTALGTVEGTLVGTVPYMAPEQLEGKPVDARTDIFAFGSMMFEIATGKPAFSGASTAALVAAILAESRPVAAKIEPTLPRALDRIISACLARNPDDRCQHAADLLRELRWASDDVMEPVRVTATPKASSRWRVHALWAAALLASISDRTSQPLPLRLDPGTAAPVNLRIRSTSSCLYGVPSRLKIS